VSAFEATANLSDWSLPNYSINPSVGPRAGAGIYTLYRCRDGYIRMIILVKRHWRALLDWVGHPEELEDPKYDEFIHRLMDLPKIVSVLERFFEDKDKVEVACEAQRRGIPATPLLRPAEVMENEHTVARGTFARLPIGGGHEALAPSGFFTIDGERAGPSGGPPEPDAGADVGFREGPAREAFAALFARPRGEQGDGHPLRGVRVLDFGVGAVGVEAGRLLAEYGADVVKVETREAPDFIRVIMSSYMNPSFASSSRSKRSFGVNLKSPEGVELVRRLIDGADVFIENNGTGVTERLGFGAEALHARNPRIVSFSSQMVGSYGPWKDWIGYGPNTHPVSGLQHLWNYPEDEDSPAGSTNVYPDHFVGRLGALAVMASLIGRERTGRGQHNDAAQFEAAIQLLGDVFAQESLAPGSVHPLGNASERGAPWGCYRCAGEDEWCVVTVRSDAEWERLRGVMGDPEWARRAGLETAAGRIAARAEIDERLGEWTIEREPRDVMERLQEAGVPCGIVAHPGHHIGDPQLAHRGYPKLVDQPGLTTMLLEGPGFLASDMPEVVVTPAPWLGEHTREIARDRLGLEEVEIERLVAEGVLEDPPTEFKVV
jgi:crotonobetainyl-CoA:carnitine CoA-transferase CaiB-like acyl-CoA transferase